MKFNLGCGKDIRPGYINVDADPKGKDVVVADVLNLPYEDGVADEILSSHLIEHLDKNEIKVFFSECYRLLKPNGKIYFIAPDMEDWILAWVNKQIAVDYLDDLLYALQKHKYDYHKQGIYATKLRRLCKNHGFKVLSIEKKDPPGSRREIHLKAEKI